MNASFEGHYAVVVGAAGAIGSAICRAYVEAGAHIWILDLDETKGRRLAEDLGEGARSARVDVTDPDDLRRAAALVWERSPFDSLVYAPGIDVTANVTELDSEDYRRVMATNLDGAFYTASAFGKRMLSAARPGSFVFISSVAGKRGEAGASAYCASKFGMIGLVQSFAAEVAEQGIRVNAICPGNVDSPLLRSIASSMAEREGVGAEAIMDGMIEAAAARRLVSVEEVAAVALWLASDSAAGVTGASINVDAGTLMP
jgi:NAD(P)-dependent dehydrogenase (short-subunit alcohol dehydrogenase family)